MDPNTKASRYLIIDTCVIQHSASSEKSKSVNLLTLFQNLTKDNFRLAISEYSVYENLINLRSKKAAVAFDLLKSYEWKSVSTEVLIFASRLKSLYHIEKVDYMNDGDVIIGTTAFLEKGYVLTENHRDFPHPFFITEKSISLSYKLGDRVHKTLDLAIYKPQISLITRKINELNELV